MNRISRGLISILIAALLMGVVALPSSVTSKLPDWPVVKWFKHQKVTLGLDLQGGTQLDYRIDLRNAELANADEDKSNDVKINDIIEGVVTTLERRVNNIGVSEPQIYISNVGGEKHVIVELAGIKDIEEAKKIVGKTIQLEFKEPKTEADPMEGALVKAEANAALKKLQTNESDLKAYGERIRTSDKKIDLRADQTVWASDMPQYLKETLPKMKEGQIWNSVVEGSDGYVLSSDNQITERKGLYIVQFLKKENKERTTQEAGDFNEIMKKATGEEPTVLNGKNFTYFSDEVGTAIWATQPDRTTSVLEVGNELKVYKVLKQNKGATDADATVDVAVVTLAKSDENKTKLEAALKEIEPHDIKKNEDEYQYNEIFFDASPDPWKSTGLDGSHFKTANVSYDQIGNPQVSILFDNEGARMFEDLTGRLTGKRLAIFVGGELISAPNVNEKISGGAAVITGNYNLKQALAMANDLNTGAIDAPILLSGQYTISATLGEKALKVSLFAGMIGIVALAICMILYYRLLGVFAVIALSIYTITILFVIETAGIVMTLAGIAGIILSIGMAVDANILIFERTKEELNAGRNFTAAIHAGFDRAWSSIRDSNVSSLITCVILYSFGNSIIRGFALMLALGILISMFTAITVTRQLIRVIQGSKVSESKFLIGAGA
jgi:preprotein translocase subunit SecD